MSARGDVTAIIGGEEVRLSLTLGAMAEIERRLGVDSIGEVLAMVGRMSARAILVMFEETAKAGGADIDASKIDANEAFRALTSLVEAAYPESSEEDQPADGGAPVKN